MNEAATTAPILVVIDPAAGEQVALSRAAGLARRTRSPLVLVACIFDAYLAGEQRYGDIDVPKLRRNLVDAQLVALRALARPLAAQGLAVSCRAIFDHPLHEGIVREARRQGASLVVKDTHHHGALERTFLTNTDWQLIRECPCPLMLVKAGEAAPGGAILAAVDPLHEHDKPASLDHDIVRNARSLAGQDGGRVHLAHVYNPVWAGPGSALPAASAIPVSLQQEIARQIEAEHRQALDALAAGTGIAKDQVQLREGDPAEVLPALARELGTALVVMGAVARSRLKRAFVGSTAERVLEDLPCDVLIVKPAGFESPVSSRGKARGYVARTAHYAAH